MKETQPELKKVYKCSPKAKFFILLSLFIVLLILAILGVWILRLSYLEKEFKENIIQEVVVEKELDVEEIPEGEDYEVVVRENEEDENKTDVYLKDIKTDVEIFFATLGDVYRDHARRGEFNNGDVYIIKRIGYDGYPDEDWIDELWKYDSDRVGTKIYSNKGIDFRVSPDGEKIALERDGSLRFIDVDGQFLEEYSVVDVGFPETQDLGLNLWNWSDNSELLWGDLSFTAFPKVFFSINTELWSVEKYDVRDLSLSLTDLALDFNNASLAFSDFPTYFEAEGYEEFMKSGSEVTLWVYDLKTQEKQQIATSITKKFEPKWIDLNTLEYTDPESEERIQIVIE